MVAITSASFVALSSCLWIFILCQGTQELKVTAGEDATLQCRGHRGADITVIEWSRPDLKSNDYVFFFREGSSNKIYQNPSYHGRVELRDPEMKGGDASLTLKNININDTGTYECRVRERNESGKAKLISSINMTVTDSGHTAGHKEGGDKEGGGKEGNDALNVGVIILLIVVCVVFLVFGGCFVKKNFTICGVCRDNNSDQPAPENVPMQAAEPADENH